MFGNLNKSTTYRSILHPKEMHPNGSDFITNITEIKIKLLPSIFQTKYKVWTLTCELYT